MKGLRETCPSMVPFCRLFYGEASTLFWEDEDGLSNEVIQQQGGEQGDPWMPALFSLAMHPGLVRASAALEDGEAILSFLDDTYIVAKRQNVRRLYDITTRAVEEEAHIRTNQGKTRAWGAGRRPAPPGIAELGPKVWKGDTVEAERSGLLILGIPVGTIEYERRVSVDR